MGSLNIYQRINKVMQTVNYVKKDAQIRMGQGSYKAVTHDNVLVTLRNPMVQAGIVSAMIRVNYQELPQGTTKNGGTVTNLRCHMTVRYTNIDDPSDFLDVESFADGQDQGDKAPGKAMSMAFKYANLKTFDLETGENEESRVETYEALSAKQSIIATIKDEFAAASSIDELNTLRTKHRPAVKQLGSHATTELLEYWDDCAAQLTIKED
jgi:hypothetical protein